MRSRSFKPNSPRFRPVANLALAPQPAPAPAVQHVNPATSPSQRHSAPVTSSSGSIVTSCALTQTAGTKTSAFSAFPHTSPAKPVSYTVAFKPKSATRGTTFAQTSLPSSIPLRREQRAQSNFSQHVTTSEKQSIHTPFALSANSNRLCPSLLPPVLHKFAPKCLKASSLTGYPTHTERDCTRTLC